MPRRSGTSLALSLVRLYGGLVFVEDASCGLCVGKPKRSYPFCGSHPYSLAGLAEFGELGCHCTSTCFVSYTTGNTAYGHDRCVPSHHILYPSGLGAICSRIKIGLSILHIVPVSTGTYVDDPKAGCPSLLIKSLSLGTGVLPCTGTRDSEIVAVSRRRPAVKSMRSAVCKCTSRVGRCCCQKWVC